MAARYQGTVLDYDAQRGYGRLRDKDDNAYFVHFRELIDAQSLTKGQKVEFDAVLHRKGNMARQVRLL